MPKPEPCGAEFTQIAPPAAKKRVMEPRMLISVCNATEIGESCYGGGTRKSEPKEFKNGPPWVLPIFLGNVAQTEHLKGPAELPFHIMYSAADIHLVVLRFGMEFITKAHSCTKGSGIIMMVCREIDWKVFMVRLIQHR